MSAIIWPAEEDLPRLPAADTLSTVVRCAGSSFALLAADGEASMHGSSAAVAGEFAIVPPFLGSSQRLLNRDHYSVYYKVRGACASSA